MSDGKHTGYFPNAAPERVGPQVKVGDVVAIKAVDWALHSEQTSRTQKYTCIHASLYGEVVSLTEESVAIAPQVFEDDQVRCTLVVPLVCVKSIAVLTEAQP